MKVKNDLQRLVGHTLILGRKLHIVAVNGGEIFVIIAGAGKLCIAEGELAHIEHGFKGEYTAPAAGLIQQTHGSTAFMYFLTTDFFFADNVGNRAIAENKGTDRFGYKSLGGIIHTIDIGL